MRLVVTGVAGGGDGRRVFLQVRVPGEFGADAVAASAVVAGWRTEVQRAVPEASLSGGSLMARLEQESITIRSAPSSKFRPWASDLLREESRWLAATRVDSKTSLARLIGLRLTTLGDWTKCMWPTAPDDPEVLSAVDRWRRGIQADRPEALNDLLKPVIRHGAIRTSPLAGAVLRTGLEWLLSLPLDRTDIELANLLGVTHRPVGRWRAEMTRRSARGARGDGAHPGG